MRPIPVTAWLPLSMILFGLGAKSAFALVSLGAFYPILLNTIFGVRSVDPKLFEAASHAGLPGQCAVLQGRAARRDARRSSPACGSGSASPGS